MSDQTKPAAATRRPLVLAPGQGRAYPMGRIAAVFKADEAETDSRYSVSEWWLEPNTCGPGPHSHEEDDLFYVVEGVMSVFVQDTWHDCPKGAFVLVPGGVTHDFENRGHVRAGLLNFSSPGPFEPDMPGIAAWFAENPPKDARAPDISVHATAREIPAAPAAVFAAFADPDRLATWWGPAGFTNTFELCEFVPGGRWIYVMHGPGGKHYPNESVFREIGPERIVIEHVSQPRYVLTIVLEPTDDGGTMLQWAQAFEDPRVATGIAHIVIPANEQNLDRLSAEVLRLRYSL